MENNQQDSFLQMHLDYDGGNILRETVRWSRFFSLVCIVALSICLLLFVLAGSAILSAFSRLAPGIEGLENLGGAILILAIVIVVAIFGFIFYMLYRFSVLTRKAIEHQDQTLFAEAMKCLKIYFIATAILSVLTLLSNLSSLTNLF